MRTVLLFVLQVIAIVAGAQRECASVQYHNELRTRNKALQQQDAAIETFIQRHQSTGASNSSAKFPVGVIRIPVVVHIMENGKFTISDARVRGQIEALNRDLRKRNADTTSIPNRFKNFAADVEIEFVLASADPKGRATTGIIRKATTVTNWEMDDKIKFASTGGSNAWDPSSYLNIWVGPMYRVLGYSSVPGDPIETDGVVINPSAFGTTGAAAPFNLGRTATHEVGHWLGLIHLWGDDYCGDDKVSDTPIQGMYTTGCPSGVLPSCNNSPDGIMYMNYMDYVNDACMFFFTAGQKTRMRSLFADGGVRASLLYSKGLNAPWSTEVGTPDEDEPQKAPPVVEVNPVKIYPNPVISELVVHTDESWVGAELQLLNMNGVVIKRITITNKDQKVPLGTLLQGVYFLRGKVGDQSINEKLIKL